MKPVNRARTGLGRGRRGRPLVPGAMPALVGALALAAALAGCLESADTVNFQPGVYQGAPDPLIGNSDAAALEARFSGQTDR